MAGASARDVAYRPNQSPEQHQLTQSQDHPALRWRCTIHQQQQYLQALAQQQHADAVSAAVRPRDARGRSGSPTASPGLDELSDLITSARLQLGFDLPELPTGEAGLLTAGQPTRLRPGTRRLRRAPETGRIFRRTGRLR